MMKEGWSDAMAWNIARLREMIGADGGHEKDCENRVRDLNYSTLNNNVDGHTNRL